MLMYNRGKRAIPVYLIVGFLEAGKTGFIQDTLEDEEFDNGKEKTLLICCEEGEREYNLGKLRSKTVLKIVENESDLSEELLSGWAREEKPDRVLIEYNGMWQISGLFNALPENWIVQQKFFFADKHNFLSYNRNMRSLVFDKLQGANLVVLNRWEPGIREDDVLPFHKIVRAVSRSAEIIYEDITGQMRVDEITDPMPFDKEADIIEIEDKDYAFFYQDLNEDLESYDGKRVRFKGQVFFPKEFGRGELLSGRYMMNCCAADIGFAGLYTEGPRRGLNDGDWAEFTALVKLEDKDVYGGIGPVLYLENLSKTEPAAEKVATFY